MSENASAGRGALARLLATRGGRAEAEAPFVIEHREALIYMLCEAAELEHAIMCQYLYAAFSLKQSTDEGLTASELAAVDRWRKTVAHIGTQEMLHLTLVQNLLSAVGAAPHFARPNLPQPAGHYPPGVILTLMPFGEAALQHFMFLERPEGMDLADAEGLDAVERSAPAMYEGEIVPRLQDFATVGHLYRSIEAGIGQLCEKYGEPWLFVGPPEAQASLDHFRWPELVQVTDASSALRAIDTILEQGEGPRGHWRHAHFGRFVDILDEYFHLKRANPDFEPARPVLACTVRPGEGEYSLPVIGNPLTAKCTDLFNVGYEVLLQTLERYFAHTEETDGELGALAQVTLGLMFNVLKPLGALITTLPVGDDRPGLYAGPSFELFYQSDYLLPHRDAAWALIEERLREAAAFADRVRAEAAAGTASRLEPVCSALLDLAHTLAEHRAGWGGISHAGDVTIARRVRDAQRARTDLAVQEQVNALAASLRAALAAEQSRGLTAMVAAAALKLDVAEGGLDEEDAQQVRNWKRGLLAEADQSLDHVTELADLAVAVSGASQFHPPEPDATFTPGNSPFSASVLGQMSDAAGAGMEVVYQSVTSALQSVTPEALLIEPHPGRRTAAQGDRLPRAVVDRASALSVIEAMARNPDDRAGPPNLDQIADELSRAFERRGASFQPVRTGAPPSATTQEGGGAQVARLLAETYRLWLGVLGDSPPSSTDPFGARQWQRESSLRLRRRVLRPLSEALFQLADDPILKLRNSFQVGSHGRAHSWPEQLRSLAVDATRTAAGLTAAPPQLAEAVAGLQELVAIQAVNAGDDATAVLQQCREAQATLEPSIQLVRNGPYLLTNVDRLVNAYGVTIPTRPRTALCRCGQSSEKPYCDGSHARVDFTGDKDPNRIPDRRDTHVGLGVTVFDNRGICQHSGFCTDRLPIVFRAGQEPFVAASGGRVDEIIRAVRNCPSGALSLASDGREARETVDWHLERPAAVAVTKDGPYRVTGALPLVDESGAPAARNEGASLEHYALCRCGHSQNKPFCSGMHWYIDFRDPVLDADRPPTVFEWCGGLPALSRTTRLFYERYVPDDPLLAPLFADTPADAPERLALLLGQAFGGPPLDGDTDGDVARLFGPVTVEQPSEDQRARWVELLCRSALETGLGVEPEFWSAFTSYLEWASRQVLSQPADSAHPTRALGDVRWDWGPAGPPPVPTNTSEEAASDHVSARAPGEPISYADHIKPLFRDRDRQSMTFAFDLWSYDDVCKYSDGIMSRIRAGNMPCDEPWNAAHIALLQRWIDGGMQP
jgi:CDGSH-type Zn-finger protein/truncated hemoglobin YjbI